MELDLQTGLHFQEMPISRWLTQRQSMTNQAWWFVFYKTQPHGQLLQTGPHWDNQLHIWYLISNHTLICKGFTNSTYANEYKQQSSAVPVNNTPKFQWNIVYSSFQMRSVLYTIHLPEPPKTRVHQMWPSKHTLPINLGHTLATH
jgi:hypothetical protein